MRRLVLVLSSLLLVALLAAASAQAAKVPACGTKDADGNLIRGSLALNDNSSTTKGYGTDKGSRELALLYSVEGCVLPAAVTAEQIKAGANLQMLPATSGDDLPSGDAVQASVLSVDPSATAVKVALNLDDIDPGTRGGVVRLHLPAYLNDSLTPVSISRTAGLSVPVLLGLLGALGGLVWAIGLHVADAVPGVRFGTGQLVMLVVLVLGAGLAAGYAYWDNQDVWTFGANGFATLTAGFVASTTGALAGVTAALFSTPDGDGDGDSD